MSTLNHSRSVIDNLVTGIKKDKRVRVNLVDVDRSKNEGYARIIASVVHTSESRKNPKLVLESLSALCKNNVLPVENSFAVISSNKVGDVITGIVSANPQTIAFDESVSSSFRSLSGNMFMDEEENLWALRKTEAGEILVKSRGKDDFDVIGDLLSSLSSSNVGSMAYEATASLQKDINFRDSLNGGDFVLFVNPETDSVEVGAVVASVFDDLGKSTGQIAVISANEDRDDTVIIDRNLVVCGFDADIDDEGLVDNASLSGEHTLDSIAAFYRQVFSRDPKYFEEFMSRWTQHNFA